jgi:2,4-dienoyl-CoA reductase-like NADH-dependent reductase (Old Yellow Enzyme family)
MKSEPGGMISFPGWQNWLTPFTGRGGKVALQLHHAGRETFAKAAGRAKKAGLNAVEIHGAHP